MKSKFYILSLTIVILLCNTLAGVCQVKHIQLQKDYEWAGAFHDGLARVVLNDKFGFINKEGKEIVPCKYEEAEDFHNGLAKVKLNHRYGIINTSGKEVLPCEYAAIDDRYDGYWNIKEYNVNGVSKFGLADYSGRVIVYCRYEQPIGLFSDGLAVVEYYYNNKKQTKYGYINIYGDEVISPYFDGAGSFCEGLATVRIDKEEDEVVMYGGWPIKSSTRSYRSAIINTKGEYVADIPDHDLTIFHDGLALSGSAGEYGFIDKQGNLVIPRKFNSASQFINGIARVSNGLKYGYINKKGQTVIPIIYESLGHFYEGLASARLNDKWGYINEKNEVIIPFIYESAFDLKDGLAVVMLNGKYGILNKEGKTVAPCKYDKIEGFSEGFVAVQQNGNWGFVSKNGKEITCKYQMIGDFSNGLAQVKQWYGGWGYINSEGQEIIPCKYSYCEPFSEGLAAVGLGDNCGYINKNGDVVLHTWIIYEYDEMRDFVYDTAVVRKGDKWGMINKENKFIIPCIYDEEIKFKSDLAIVSIDGKWGCVRSDGVVVVNCIYDEKFSFDDNGIAKVCKDGKYGMIRENGQFILGCKYDKIGEYNKIIMQVMKDGQYGYVDRYGIEDYVQCNIIEYKKNVLTIQSSFNIANNRSSKFILIRYDNSNPDSFRHEVEHLVTMGITGGSKFVKPICALQLKSGQSTLNCTSGVLEVLDKTELAKLKKKKKEDSAYYILVRLSDEQYAAMVAKKQQNNTRERQYLNSRTGSAMQSLRGFGSNLQRATGWGF